MPCVALAVRLAILSLSCSSLAIAESKEVTACLRNDMAMTQSGSYLEALISLPTPPFVAIESRGESRFIPANQLFHEFLGSSVQAIILNNVEELRFISYTLAGTALLLVVNSAPDWTEQKSRKVVSVAKTLGISLSVVWLSEQEMPSQLTETIKEINGRVWRANDVRQKVLQKFCLASQT